MSGKDDGCGEMSDESFKVRESLTSNFKRSTPMTGEQVTSGQAVWRRFRRDLPLRRNQCPLVKWIRKRDQRKSIPAQPQFQLRAISSIGPRHKSRYNRRG